MSDVLDALVGAPERALLAAVKVLALFVTAVVVFRLTGRRALTELAPFDFVTAVAVGALIGRTATATDASWLDGAAALITLLLAHLAVVHLRFLPGLRRMADPPPRLLVHDGAVQQSALRRCGLTRSDLDIVLRQHGVSELAAVRLAVFEPNGAISIITHSEQGGPADGQALPVQDGPPGGLKDRPCVPTGPDDATRTEHSL
ncbi:hypothetical protein Acor_84050 [Acrocarpospora corrugata]|uniref:DUF421 domain-containing protein n=1 Tax=Acrocarpospora corrugata TaxID=35763 RepID=A0A5M3WBX0_9ACTN|nr:YetF domain-containing protein [Acrocarpospora corrugata]GES06336.1 hypothetical protein Acor_84050 [Acrocarpospora corrugata]